MSHCCSRAISFTLLLFGLADSVRAAEAEPPITGKAVPHLQQLDRRMLEFLREYNIPNRWAFATPIWIA